ncbi:MAG TPA: hypothetical protein PKL57_16635 [Candidatus Wallbacteria bacterium]|nr:hypothetical protein [Candidatus Wallbacteria bacterium]
MTVKRWSKEDEMFLMNSYSRLDNNKLADHFGVSKIAIQRKLARLKLLRQYQKKWTESEEKFLFENFMKMSDRELAKVFNVTEISIKRKLARLGCRRNLRQKRQKPELTITIKSRQDYKTAKARTASAAFAVGKKSLPESSPKENSVDCKTAKPARNVKTINRQIPLAPAAGKEPSQASASAKNEFEKDARPLNDGEKSYSCHKSYEIGDMIYHKTWNDRGRVVKIIRTAGGHKAVVIEFDKNGQKTLLSEIKEADEL